MAFRLLAARQRSGLLATPCPSRVAASNVCGGDPVRPEARAASRRARGKRPRGAVCFVETVKPICTGRGPAAPHPSRPPAPAAKSHAVSFSLPFRGRDGEAQPSPGGERQSRTTDARFRSSPPCRRFAPTSLPTSGEGERGFNPSTAGPAPRSGGRRGPPCRPGRGGRGPSAVSRPR